MNVYKSIFSNEMSDHFAMRSSICGEHTMRATAAVLHEFDSYLRDIGLYEKKLDEQTVENWIQGLSGKTHTIAGKISQLRLFCKYLYASGIDVYIPPAYKTRDEYVPYLFSDEECEQIFCAVDNIDFSVNQTNPWIQIELPVILRLLFSCGLRLGETISLQIQNIDFDGGFLILRRTKNQKERLVPLSSSMFEILSRYCLVMNMKKASTVYLFPGKNQDTPISGKAVRRQFDRLTKMLQISGEAHQPHERGPCMHCFRHTFAFKSFAKAEAAGRSLNDSVPFLSTYLGHKNLDETEKYLKFSSTMYPNAMRLFENYIGDVFPEVTYE